MKWLATRRLAFTLIELLVVISIVAMLVAILLPALGRAKAEAAKVVCLNNERQIGVAMANYGSETKGACARANQGRTDGSWATEYASICNDRAVGIPVVGQIGYPSDMHLGIYQHGSWLINGYTSPAVYFCPALTSEKVTGWGQLATRKTQIKSWLEYFRSGGMSGSTPGRNASNTSSYHFNNQLRSTIWWHGTVTEFRRENGWKYEQMPSYFPVLTDWRGGDGNGGAYAYHDSKGFNVLCADASSRYFTSRKIITAGASPAVGGTWGTYFQNWVNAGSELPPSPTNDTSFIGAAIDPFCSYPDPFFEAVLQTVKGAF